MPHTLNMIWVQDELIPFLNLVYNVVTGHTPKKHEEWEAEVACAEKRINTIRNYDDSIISIHRIRLMLTSSPNVDAEDRAQASQIIGVQELIITMLVRHAISHGPYQLISLGVGKNPDALREREKLRQKKQKLPDIVTVKASGRGAGGLANYPPNNNPSSSGRNRYLPNWNPMPQYLPSTQITAYTPTASTSGFSPLPYQVNTVSQPDLYKGAYPQENYDVSVVPQVNSNNVSAPSMTYSPPAFAGHKNGDAMEYTAPVNGQIQILSAQDRLQVHAPVFVPGREIHNTLHAPEFVPGVQVHVNSFHDENSALIETWRRWWEPRRAL